MTPQTIIPYLCVQCLTINNQVFEQKLLEHYSLHISFHYQNVISSYNVKILHCIIPAAYFVQLFCSSRNMVLSYIFTHVNRTSHGSL